MKRRLCSPGGAGRPSGDLRRRQEIVEIAVEAFCTNDLQLAAQVEPLEQVVDNLRAQLKASHINRLQKGECTVELGFVFSDC